MPDIGGGVGLLDQQKEKAIGEKVFREVNKQMPVTQNPWLEDRLFAVFSHILSQTQLNQPVGLLIINDPQINAFAVPGGLFALNTGLINSARNMDEVAGVMAHEIAHVTQRHYSRSQEAFKGQGLLSLAGILVGALVASQADGDVGAAVMLGSQAALMDKQLTYSRNQEREADRIGYGLMAPAGFAPQGFVSMFEKLQQANRLNDNGSWPYLRSHPLTTERMADMQSRIPPGAASAPGSPMQTSSEHAMVAARARVLSNPGVDTLRQWIAEPKGSGFQSQPLPRRAAALYAAALASSQLRDAANARLVARQLDDLVRQDPAAHRLARLLMAEIELAAGDASAALASMPEGNNARRPELVLRTQALLRANRAADATQALQTWVATHPKDATVWQLLASSWQAQGQALRAIRAEAEAQAARYDYAAAVDRFKAGQEMARRGGPAVDHIEASIIDTRLRAMESLLREQAAER